MAKVRGGLSRALLKYPEVDLSNIRLIGWGAGQSFRDYYPYLRLPLAYTVCPNAENQGKCIHGVDVRSPNNLLDEDAAQILVVVFALHFPEIMTQIAKLSPALKVVRGVAFESNDEIVNELLDLRSNLGCWQFRKAVNAERRRVGIFMQGPVHEYTPVAMAYNRLRNPSAYLCLVTWTDELEYRVAQCRQWADEVITIEPPRDGFHDTRNLIARSCRAGSEHMMAAGIEYVVRARSDAILTGSLYRTLQRLYGDGGDNPGKVGILLSASWKYLPFYFSDKLMAGRAKDINELFSLPEDNRPREYFTWDPSDHFLELRKIGWEARLWSQFAQRRGYAVDTLADAYRFAREQLLELDSSLSMFSLKHVPLFDLDLRTEMTASVEWWYSMMSDFDRVARDAERISRSTFTIADFFSNKVS